MYTTYKVAYAMFKKVAFHSNYWCQLWKKGSNSTRISTNTIKYCSKEGKEDLIMESIHTASHDGKGNLSNPMEGHLRAK